jgi:hypothetical protein
LLRRLDLQGFQNTGGLKVAKQICQWLGYLPLGLELVGRYLARKPELTLATLEDLRDDQLVNLSLLNYVENDSYLLHQLLRKFFAVKRSQMAEDEAMLSMLQFRPLSHIYIRLPH